MQSEAILNTFFFLMAIHPDIMRRAQEELDGFTNTTQRLPTFSDREKLPYSECLVKELYRYVTYVRHISPWQFLISDGRELPVITRHSHSVSIGWCQMLEISAHPPLGLPHRAMQDDAYEGWTIPAGSMVVPNMKYVTHINCLYALLTLLNW